MNPLFAEERPADGSAGITAVETTTVAIAVSRTVKPFALPTAVAVFVVVFVRTEAHV